MMKSGGKTDKTNPLKLVPLLNLLDDKMLNRLSDESQDGKYDDHKDAPRKSRSPSKHRYYGHNSRKSRSRSRSRRRSRSSRSRSHRSRHSRTSRRSRSRSRSRRRHDYDRHRYSRSQSKFNEDRFNPKPPSPNVQVTKLEIDPVDVAKCQAFAKAGQDALKSLSDFFTNLINRGNN